MSEVTEHPKQCKLLGARVDGYGIVYAVSQHEYMGFALIGGGYYWQAVRLRSLKRLPLKMPKRQQPYLESYQENCGTDMYVLSCTLEEVKLRPPTYRRQSLRRWGVGR